MENKSPWIVKSKPSFDPLHQNIKSDVVILGGGISGIATLYYLLHLTSKKVALIEKNTIGSGATGHNAGIAISHIEKPLSILVNEYGIEETRKAYAEVDEGKTLLDEILTKLGATSDAISFDEALFGISSLTDLKQSLEAEQMNREWNRSHALYLVADLPHIKEGIPKQLWNCLEFTPHFEVLRKLEVHDTSYIAVAIRKSSFGLRINTFSLCQKMVNYLTTHFKERFSIYENSPVERIDIDSASATLHAGSFSVQASHVILCTNGYKGYSLIDIGSEQEITKYSHNLTQREGYLAAYPIPVSKAQAIGLLPSHDEYPQVPYWYTTRIPLKRGGMSYHMIGGPEFDFKSPAAPQELEKSYEESFFLIKKFLENTFHEKREGFPYFWHGTMGYTASGLRWVGQDPDHPALWYNQGCNGIGIIPAIAGAKKVALKMEGFDYESSIFDPN